ncbi:MAG: PEP-utilizing enzyme [Porticoccaceae bacterium]
MKKIPLDFDRYERPVTSPLVEATLSLIQDRVRQKMADGKLTKIIADGDHPHGLITKDDLEQIEKTILDSGYRYTWSAGISVEERPEIYQQEGVDSGQDFAFDHPEAITEDVDAEGRRLSGFGDNVVRYPQNIKGIARYIRTNARVLEYLTNGVPPNTIAVIDDSGGTLTAPIIEYFSGVICAGGTVRSHLGILTREYGIPCVMNAKISGIKDGDVVEIESSAAAKTAEDYQANTSRVAKVWRLSENNNDE